MSVKPSSFEAFFDKLAKDDKPLSDSEFNTILGLRDTRQWMQCTLASVLKEAEQQRNEEKKNAENSLRGRPERQIIGGSQESDLIRLNNEDASPPSQNTTKMSEVYVHTKEGLPSSESLGDTVSETSISDLDEDYLELDYNESASENLGCCNFFASFIGVALPPLSDLSVCLIGKSHTKMLISDLPCKVQSD